jgi:hypothetical protein
MSSSKVSSGDYSNSRRGQTPRRDDAEKPDNVPADSETSHSADGAPSETDRRSDPVISGVRTISTPPGEPYKDVHLRKS